MGKLHELIAVEPDLKGRSAKDISDVATMFTAGQGRFVGQTREYAPLDEEGERLAGERQELATTVPVELQRVQASFGSWMDVSVNKELTNGSTVADVVIDGKVVIPDLSSPALLNLESKLSSLRVVYEAIPTNDPAERWTYDPQIEVYVSDPKVTYRTNKIPKALIGAPATPEHPANVQYYNEDVRVGTWTTVKRSGMLSPSQKRELLDRLDTLFRAVKSARQRANDIEAEDRKTANAVFAYIHGE